MSEARRKAAAAEKDAGFVLPYVLLITFLIMVGTATMLRVVTDNIAPARKSQSSETALAAAQAGIQAYLAQLNANCSNYYTVTSSYSIQECSWPASAAATPLQSGANGAPALSTGSYSVQASNTSGFLNANDDDIRVISQGTANGVTVKLVADFSGTPSALRFSYFTNHESTDPKFLAKYFKARTIALSGTPLLSLLGFSIGTGSASVTWGGVTTTSAANCGAVWYNDPGNPSVNGNGRSSAGDDIVELPTNYTGSGTASIDHNCSVDFTAGMTFNGPVYSHDALYISNGVPGNTTGPSFSVPTPCGGTTVTFCEPLPPASSAWSTSDTPVAPGSPYRSFADPLGGTPTSTNTTVQTVQTSHFDVTLPSSVSDDPTLKPTCTYTGNTTIAFTGSTATVSGAGAAGQAAGCLSITVAKTTLYVLGDATVTGGSNLTGGQLSIVASGDIVLNGNVTTSASAQTTPKISTGEPYISGTDPALDLVAVQNVRVVHDVTCASGSIDAGTGYCKNDITGLYTTSQAGQVVNTDGSLKSTHPARQYCNSSGNKYPCSGSQSTCDTGSGASGLRIDAAVFALNGSLQTDNYSRGCALGTMTVNGGMYSNFRGPVGQEWEVPSSGATVRSYTGYKLKLNYVSLESAGLPYVPALEGGTANHPWEILSVSGAS